MNDDTAKSLVGLQLDFMCVFVFCLFKMDRELVGYEIRGDSGRS